MLSKETVKFVILSLRIADRLYSHPLTWHEETRSVRVREKGLWRWHLLTLLMGAYGLFAVARFLEDFLLLGKPLSDCILSIYFAIGHIYFNTIQQNLRVHKHDMASFLTLFINFDASTASEEKNGCVRDRVGKIFGYLILLGYSHAFFQGVMFLYFSGNKNFIYTAFERIPGAEGLGVKLLFALFEIMYHIQAWTATLMNTFVLFASLENIALWNEHVSKKDAWVEEKERYYRSLQLILNRFNECFGEIVFPGGQICVLFEATVSLYATIRFYGVLPLPAYMIMPVSCAIMVIYTSIVYRFSGKIYDSFQAVLQGWQEKVIRRAEEGRSPQATPRLLERMYLRSCPHLGIKVGAFYFIKRGTTVTYCAIMVNNTINLLLA